MKEKPEELLIGKAELVEPGEDAVIFGLGALLPLASEAAAKVRREGFSAAVVNPRFVKPVDKELIAKLAERAKVFVTMEDHVLMGGFGSVVLETLNELGMDVPVVRIGWPDQFIEHGKVEALRERYGITAEAAARGAFSILKRTKRKMLA